MPGDEASILHVDLDAFFASVEQLLEPALVGRPVIVGGLGPRGVVSAASYEARRFGVHSAMPMARARRLCPRGVFLPPRFGEYEAHSRAVMDVLRSVTPLVEPLSIDEAFLDVSGARRLFGPGEEIGRLLRRRIREEVGLVASVGVATTKFLAKLAGDMAKPDGLLLVPPGHELEFLHPLPVGRLWGVGPATLAKLERIGVRTIGDLAALPAAVLAGATGKAVGAHLHALARNEDPRDVTPGREAKSVGAEETFAVDLRDRGELAREIIRLSDKVASRLRGAGLAARTVTLKVRYADFETITRSRTLGAPTDLGADLAAIARELLAGLDLRRGVRLLGVSTSQLAVPGPTQGVLDLGYEDDGPSRVAAARAAVERSVDAVRARFGPRSVRPATLVEPPGGEDAARGEGETQ